jgi:hypothetical protein
MVFVRRPRPPGLGVHSASSCSDAGKGLNPRTAQMWMKSFLGVVCGSGLGAESPPEIWCGLGGEVAILVPGVWCVVCNCFYCKFGQRSAIFCVSQRESVSPRALSLFGIHTQCSSISCSAMCMAICQSRLIAWHLMLLFASAATTALWSQCSLILLALNSVVQVHRACTTAPISLKLM